MRNVDKELQYWYEQRRIANTRITTLEGLVRQLQAVDEQERRILGDQYYEEKIRKTKQEIKQVGQEESGNGRQEGREEIEAPAGEEDRPRPLREQSGPGSRTRFQRTRR
jgi:hypothetical protein